MKKLTVCLPAVAALLAVSLLATSCRGRDVPYVPTPDRVVHKMLEMGEVGPGDIVYDLGSGDGRIVISAVRDFNAARAVGVDIDRELVFEGARKARTAGVSDRTAFLHQDIFETDFSEATVLTMYLLTKINLRLRPRILSALRPGTRVVSHQFSMGDWEPDETASVGVRTVHLWIVPAEVAGRWRGTLAGRPFRIDLTQQYQKVAGAMSLDDGDTAVSLDEATLTGDRLQIAAHVRRGGRNVPLQLDGRVRGDRLTGSASLDGQTSTVTGRRVGGGE